MSKSDGNSQHGKKTYHKKASGKALQTVLAHSTPHDLKLYGSCFWYVQRSPLVIHTETNIQPIRPARMDLAGAETYVI